MNASGEPVIPQLQDCYQNQDMEPNSSSEFWALCAARQRYQTQYKAYWNSVGATTRSGRTPDGVILPVAPTLAVRPGEFSYCGYSAIANALDCPSGVFPVTTGDGNLDLPSSNLVYLSDVDKTVQQSCKLTFCTGARRETCPTPERYNQANRTLYSFVDRVEDIHGLPVSLQVMAYRLQEEVVLGLMEAIRESLADAG